MIDWELMNIKLIKKFPIVDKSIMLFIFLLLRSAIVKTRLFVVDIANFYNYLKLIISNVRHTSSKMFCIEQKTSFFSVFAKMMDSVLLILDKITDL